jgi:hypothetical protein
VQCLSNVWSDLWSDLWPHLWSDLGFHTENSVQSIASGSTKYDDASKPCMSLTPCLRLEYYSVPLRTSIPNPTLALPHTTSYSVLPHRVQHTNLQYRALRLSTVLLQCPRQQICMSLPCCPAALLLYCSTAAAAFRASSRPPYGVMCRSIYPSADD